MKKILCLLLAFVMLASLWGCAGGSENDVRGDITPGTSNQEPQFSLGSSANNTYTNKFLGISCTLPDAWYFYTDEEILELNNITLTDDIVGEDYLKQLENATVIYDMYAVNEESGSSININLEKLNALQIATLDLKKTLEAQIDTIVSAYQNMGYTDVKVYYQKVTVDGKEFDGLRLTAKIQGIDFNGVVFTFRKSNYLANITLATLAEDTTGALLDCFTIQ